MREAFIQFLRHEKGLCENTIIHYLKPLMMLSKYCTNLLSLEKYQDVANLIVKIKTERNWSNRTTYKTASICAIFFNWAARNELIKESPMRLGHQFKKGSDYQAEFFDWDSEDFKVLFSHPGNSTRDVAILHVLRSTGLRVSEAARLQIHDVDLHEDLIRVQGSKGSGIDEVPIDDQCKQFLAPYINALKRMSFKWLFPVSAKKDQQYKAHSIWKMLNTRGKDLGIHAYPHKFRHSLAGTLISNGADLGFAAEILRHKCLSTTKEYTHFSRAKKKELFKEFISPIQKQIA